MMADPELHAVSNSSYPAEHATQAIMAAKVIKHSGVFTMIKEIITPKRQAILLGWRSGRNILLLQPMMKSTT
jgi:hypothetical protein